MKRLTYKTCALLAGAFAIVSLACGCSQSGSGGTPVAEQQKAANGLIQSVQNDPNMPPQRKQALIASLKRGGVLVHVNPNGGAPLSGPKQGQISNPMAGQ